MLKYLYTSKDFSELGQGEYLLNIITECLLHFKCTRLCLTGFVVLMKVEGLCGTEHLLVSSWTITDAVTDSPVI